MKKIIVAVTAISLVPVPGLATPISEFECCIGNKLDNCEYLECTEKNTTRYFSNCGNCENSQYTLKYNGPYTICNGRKTLSADYGECTLGFVVLDGCPAGQYGTNSLKCQDCPSPGTSDYENNSNITDCYIPAGTVGSDDKGTYKYTEDCHYSSITDSGDITYPVIPLQ